MVIKTLPFVGYPAILALEVMKRQILLPSLLWICLMSMLVYPALILTSIFFPLGKMVGMVRLQTSFILSSPSWEIWQSSYRWCRKDEVVLCRARIGHTHLIHSYILKKDLPPQCEDGLSMYSDSSPHFGVVQSFCWKKGKIYLVKTNVMESFRFHPHTASILFKRESVL